jgi:hypothetical protein
MLALKRSLIFYSGGTGGDDNPPLGERGRGIDRGEIQGYGVLFHEILLQVEVSFIIRLAYFKKGSHHPIDFKKELINVYIYSKTAKPFSSGDHIVRPSEL